MLRLFRSKIILSISLVASILLFGILGYRFISGYSWLEAIYMTIITVTTVGFSEVRPLGPEAKIFTIILIISSVFIFAFAISVITEYILSRNSIQLLKLRKVKNTIESLNNHVIVCGYGRNGMQAASRLNAYNKPFVVIEHNKDLIEKYENDVLFLEGDANDDEVLLQAGIARAQYLISALPDDAANLMVVLSARQLNKKLFIQQPASAKIWKLIHWIWSN